MRALGCTVWAIPEGYIPGESVSDAHDLVSHEAACFLNAGDRDAQITITLFFEDRDPVGPYRLNVPARRTLHMRFNDLTEPAPVPRDTSYASLIEATVSSGRSAYKAGLTTACHRAAYDAGLCWLLNGNVNCASGRC